MFKDEILENENRRSIYATIDANPGVHLRGIQRILNMPLTTLEYHLSYMVRKQIVFAESEANLRKYYVKTLDEEDKKVLSALRQKRLREIVLIVSASKKVKFQFLCDYFKLPRSTLSFYLKTLVDHGIISREKIGYETLYTVNDENRVCRVATAYKKNFWDTLIDKTMTTWLETCGKPEKEKCEEDQKR